MRKLVKILVILVILITLELAVVTLVKAESGFVYSNTPNNLDSNTLFDLVNDYRAKLSLKKFVKNDNLCEVAKSREHEMYREIFVTGRLHSGLYNRNLPYWVFENLIYEFSEQKALNWWLNSYIHKKTIENDYKYSCVYCRGLVCTQLFTSYQPK
ncbi:hypothetical protein C4577_03290 [Candidatus Parcubacteria bacterium]|nr:MAG: hypothetical protein C4577_03290 [Candidatus Parcubacteria bacterium]